MTGAAEVRTATRDVHRLPGLVLRDHVVPVPLDHTDPDGEQLTVYAREVVAPGREHEDLPWLLYLQGGPGHRADRPLSATGWLARALREFRVLLLDQRGTGRSSPVTRHTLPARGDAGAQARFLAHLRADAIVADAEVLRRRVAGGGPWSVLGQSYGGFCALTYLSFAPTGLREVVITGGLPPLAAGPEQVYERTFAAVARRAAVLRDRHPAAEDRARRVVSVLARGETTLPTGEPLSPRRFQMLGQLLGTARGPDALWYLLEDALDPRHPDRLTDSFLSTAGALLSFASAPLYAAVHESIYCQDGRPSAWAAQRVRDALGGLDPATRAGDFPWTGEAIWPWLFDTDPALVALGPAARALAAATDWGPLYDPAVLAANDVPVAAAVYLDDVYVDPGFSLETAAAVRGLRPWVTNAHQHSGLRDDGEAVLDRLLALARGEV